MYITFLWTCELKKLNCSFCGPFLKTCWFSDTAVFLFRTLYLLEPEGDYYYFSLFSWTDAELPISCNNFKIFVHLPYTFTPIYVYLHGLLIGCCPLYRRPTTAIKCCNAFSDTGWCEGDLGSRWLATGQVISGPHLQAWWLVHELGEHHRQCRPYEGVWVSRIFITLYRCDIVNNYE